MSACQPPNGDVARTILFFFGSDLCKPAKPSYQTVLKRAHGIRNQSSPVLRLSHSSVW